MMKTADFSYQLPDELIARYPMENRVDSRLLVMKGNGDIEHRQFIDLLDYLRAGDLLVMNNTEVLAARLFAKKASGGKLEVLLERVEDEFTALAHIRSSRSPNSGSELHFYQDRKLSQLSTFSATMIERQDALFRIRFSQPISDVLAAIGHMPLPPYIDRNDELDDQQRYQTVYAKTPGAVAAPTAGLHFDDALLQKIKDKGVELAEVTLHVGAGTFQPVKVDNVLEHTMHSEWIDVNEEVCTKVQAAKAAGGRVIAIGTTSVRCLETASKGGELKPYQGETDIFIYPGFTFNTIDMLVTNFHLPESTLLMLVSALSGKENIERAYREALEQRYRFFSYGDAMLLHRTTV